MDNYLKNLIEKFKSNRNAEVISLCEQNQEKKIQHIVLNIKGATLAKINNIDNAIDCFKQALQLKNDYIDVYLNLYLVFLKIKKIKDAILVAKKIIEIENNQNPNSYYNLAYAYNLNSDFDKALINFKKSEALNFTNKNQLYNNMGLIHFQKKNINDAELYLKKGLQFNHDDLIIINNLLRVYFYSRNYQKALPLYEKAKKLDLNFFMFQLNQVDYYIYINDYNSAEKILQNLLKKNNDISIFLRFASFELVQGKSESCMKIIEQGLKFYPENKQLNILKGFLLLKKGEFKKAWPLYQKNTIYIDNNICDLPIWNGESLNNKSILVFSEQGIGDCIQFSRKLNNLYNNSIKVGFVVNENLNNLFENKINNLKILNMNEYNKNEYDYKISLGSLNKFFYNKKNINLIKSDRNIIKKWSDKINRNNLNIGLVWSGNYFGTNEPYRSIKLDKFKNILKLNAKFYCLQKEIWERDIKFLENTNIINYGNFDLSNIAGIIENLDFVISTDTSILHLACSLNKETWGLFCYEPDWRWHKYYDYNKYKSLKIFKQSKFNYWDNILEIVKKEIQQKIDIKKNI